MAVAFCCRRVGLFSDVYDCYVSKLKLFNDENI